MFNSVGGEAQAIFVILELEILCPGAVVGAKIGNPQQIGAELRNPEDVIGMTLSRSPPAAPLHNPQVKMTKSVDVHEEEDEILVVAGDAGIQDHLDTDTFKLIFGYLKDNGFPAPTALQADGCKATRKGLKEIWPECDLSMCYFHTKKNCKHELGKFSIYQFISFSHQVFKKYKYCFRTKFGNVFEPKLSRFIFSQT